MFDTIGMKLKQEEVNSTDFLAEIPNYLSRFTETKFDNGVIVISGNCHNLRLSVTARYVKIKQGSLSKFFHNDPLKTLNRKEVKQAIEMLSDKLHVPFERAHLSRIDLAQDIQLNHDEKLYYNYLGEAQHYNRLEQNNGLIYETKKRVITFYGKVRELKRKQYIIPPCYQDKHIMRYEFRFLERLTQQFNLPEIKANLLYDEKFYSGLVERWKNEYFKIKKIRNPLSNMKPTGSTKEFINYFLIQGISQAGQLNVLNMISEWQTKGDISRKQASDLRKKIREAANSQDFTEENDLIIELDARIKEAAEKHNNY